MKIERTKNAVRNMFFEGLLRMFNLLMPFIMRTVILYTLGIEYLGLNGLFTSILSFLNLAELGVGSAMVFSMYKPIAEDDKKTICALMALYRKLYRIIGLVIAVAGILLIPFLPVLIKGKITADVNLYVLYIMNLATTVLTYWVFAYKSSLLKAHQRLDVSGKINLAVEVAHYSLKIAVLFLLHNYYIYLLVQMLSRVAINLFTAWQVDRMYPSYLPRGTLPKEKVNDIARRVRDLFTAKFSYVIFNSADTLVISSFMGLVSLAIYQNYYFILTAVRTMLDVVTGACTAGVGNSLITESPEKNYNDLKKLTFMYSWLVGICCAMLLCVYQPFMKIWMGEKNLLEMNCVICFVVYFYFLVINRLVEMFKDAAGIWRRDRMRPLMSAIINLALNIATVRYLGLYGILLSSVVSIVFVALPWLVHNLFLEVFPKKYMKPYIVSLVGYTLVTFVSCALSWLICDRFAFNDWVTMILSMLASFTVPNIVFFIVYGRSEVYKDSAEHIKAAGYSAIKSTGLIK